jgi:GNAT superfamily N-acetyltransferase
MIKEVQRLDEVMDFAWELSQNKLYASYPRINSIEELKEEVEKAINLENRKIIAYYNQDKLCGICFYFWISDEKYAQTAGFLIREDYPQIADGFISYISKHLPGYELFIGIPGTNRNACEYFREKNIECIEDSIVTRICNLEPHTSQRCDCIEEISKNNFKEYAVFHDKYAIPAGIYFNSENLLKKIERFRIFAFRQDGGIHGSIFVKTGKDLSDVIGLFIDEEYKNRGIESILINEMLTQLYNEFGAIKEILFFIDEDSTDELNLALNAGFEIKEKYRLYKCTL